MINSIETDLKIIRERIKRVTQLQEEHGLRFAAEELHKLREDEKFLSELAKRTDEVGRKELLRRARISSTLANTVVKGHFMNFTDPAIELATALHADKVYEITDLREYMFAEKKKNALNIRTERYLLEPERYKQKELIKRTRDKLFVIQCQRRYGLLPGQTEKDRDPKTGIYSGGEVLY